MQFHSHHRDYDINNDLKECRNVMITYMHTDEIEEDVHISIHMEVLIITATITKMEHNA